MFAAKAEPTALSLSIAGNAGALEKYLAGLKPRSQQRDIKPKRSFSFLRGNNRNREPDVSSLEDALLSSDDLNRTPLLLATKFDHLDCIRVLLNAASQAEEGTLKEMLNIEDKCFGLSPLDYAIYRCKKEAILLYLRSGVDFWAPSEEEESSSFEFILREPDCPIVYLTRRTAKYPAKYLPLYKDVLKLMAQMDPNFDINRSTFNPNVDEDNTPLPNEDGRNEEDAIMEDATSDLAEDDAEGELPGNANDDDGVGAANRPPHRAPRGNNRRIPGGRRGRMGRNGFGDPVLDRMLAAHMGRLFDEVERTPKRTLLNTAAKYGSVDVIRHLIKLGAKPEGGVFYDCIRYLQEQGRDSYLDRYAAFGESGLGKASNAVAGLACMKALVDAGADVNYRDSSTQETPLHAAVLHECVPAVKMLLEMHPDLTLRNREDKTALDIAREVSNEEIEDLLTHQSRISRLISPPVFGRSESLKNVDVPADQRCSVCWERPKVVILAPCGHRAMCKTCMRKLLELPKAQRVCPIDRTPIEGFVTAVYEV